MEKHFFMSYGSCYCCFCNRQFFRRKSSILPPAIDEGNKGLNAHLFIRWEELVGENNREAEDGGGSRVIPFSKELWIEREDFMEDPPKKIFRLGVGKTVRLKSAYIVKCTGYNKNEAGNVTEVLAEYIPESKSGHDTSAINVKGTIHWVSVPDALTAEVRLYDRLFTIEDPGNAEGDFKDYINPNSLQVVSKVFIEPALGKAVAGEPYQFLRKGYFCLDESSSKEKLVFNRTVSLKDTWAKEVKKP